jgi:hypothetical protein
MVVGRLFGKTGWGLAVAAALLAVIGSTTVLRPANAGGGWGGGGISPGAAVGLGLGAFALGSVLSRPYYSPYYYPYGYYGYPPAPAYYPPAAHYPYYPPPSPAFPPSSSYTPQPTYTPRAGRSGGNIARQLNQQELNYLQAAPVNPQPAPYYPYSPPPRY